MSSAPPKVRKCGHCKGTGHDKRNCPVLKALAASNLAVGAVGEGTVATATPTALVTTTQTLQSDANINWDKVCYVLFDLETTAGARSDQDIIEISAVILGPHGIALEDGSFTSYVHTNKEISPFITGKTSISATTLVGAPDFSEVAVNFFCFIDRIVSGFASEEPTTEVDSVVFVAHNGKAFDFPILLHSLKRHDLFHLWEANSRYGLTIDTLEMARKIFISGAKPSNNKLGTLYQFFTGSILQNAHQAYHDVTALSAIFRNNRFWDVRSTYCKWFGLQVPVSADGTSTTTTTILPPAEVNDSDVSCSDDEEEEEEEEEQPPPPEPEGDYWESDEDYVPDEIPMEKFMEFSTSVARSRVLRTGIQIPADQANSPRKAWNLIFQHYILDKIVRHTNKYGQRECKDWTDINKKDLLDFIAVLFLMSVQKRKDKPQNWFCDDPIFECKLAKKVMTGRQFGKMLRYLHCCDPDENGIAADGTYDPSYKVADFKNDLEKRWSLVFIPHQELSLDETLLRAFGRIKFKVRIVSKAARYGIKLYVLTDARTAFVLRVVVYTGQSTYNQSDTESNLKTVQVVQKLCENYRGSFRTVYVDRFYTSVDLLKQLEDMNLYVTGTMLSNRIPQSIHRAKSSKAFKTMRRGEFIKHSFNYKTLKGERKRAGLVQWKDRAPVICLTNDTSTIPTDTCKRRSAAGLIELTRPSVIGKYNQFMGGVDVADKRRLFADSTIRCQNRWWLKLFFYLLDAGTSNACVLYNEAMSGKQPPYNIIEFKSALVEWLIGDVMKGSAEIQSVVEHRLVEIPNKERQKCSYCSLMGNTQCRTRFMCPGCEVPYCAVWSGEEKKMCFEIAHGNEQIQSMCIQRYERAQQHTMKDVKQKRRRNRKST